MKKITYLMLMAVLISFGKKVHAQLYPVNITEKVVNANLIVEGKVVSQQSFWNEAHTLIFTSNTIELYKSFKGQAPEATVEVLTQGGVVDNQGVVVSDLGQLSIGDQGIFFLYPNTINLKSPESGRLLYDIYASDQGILRYSIAGNQAYCPFEKYNGITSNLYSKLETLTGKQPAIINSRYNVDEEIAAGNVQGQRLEATITSTSPAIVHAGAVLDPINNILTINGTGFGNSATANHYLLFKDADQDVSYPTIKVGVGVNDNPAYLISWSNTVIKVNVPSKAANGRFGIYFGPGDTAFAPQPLKVRFSVLNAILQPTSRVQEPRLTAMNDNGGYDLKYSINITTSPIYNTFRRALATWKETTGVNFTETGNTILQTVNTFDNQNIIMLDNTSNTNIGIPVLPAGVLANTYSGFEVCAPGTFNIAQKKGFDIVIRNQGVSVGTILFENGPCPPAFVDPGKIDIETVLLHELGHALNLAHVNDPQEVPDAAPFYSVLYINPAGLMHYTVDKWSSRRSPDESAYSGALYATTPRGISLGSCLASTEMVRLPTLVPANDNCPIVFPTAYTAQGTTYNMDLVHATSSKSVDPQFTVANCSQPVSVTNNIYQVIRTSYNGTLDLTISNYATTPTPLPDSCGMNKGVRLSIYDVASCPSGQDFPAPFKCVTFTGNGTLPTITGLGAKKTYLLFFEGVRNSKAAFNIKLTGTSLAVSKLSLIANRINSTTNKLTISSQQAVQVKSVIVERSADGAKFGAIGQVSDISNSFDGSYDFTDMRALQGMNYYRLKTTHFDGTAEYSAIVALEPIDDVNISLQPNPFHSFINVTTRQKSSSRLTVVISDAVSRKIIQSTFTGSVQISTASLAKGTYLVSVYDAGGQLLATRKMMKD